MESATNFKQNMKTFIKNFGVSIEIPGMYQQSAAIIPKDPKWVLQCS